MPKTPHKGDMKKLLRMIKPAKPPGDKHVPPRLDRTIRPSMGSYQRSTGRRK